MCDAYSIASLFNTHDIINIGMLHLNFLLKNEHEYSDLLFYDSCYKNNARGCAFLLGPVFEPKTKSFKCKIITQSWQIYKYVCRLILESMLIPYG